MRSTRALVVFGLLLVGVFAAWTDERDEIRICSWNICEFGARGAYLHRDYQWIARFLSRLDVDIVVIQEVQPHHTADLAARVLRDSLDMLAGVDDALYHYRVVGPGDTPEGAGLPESQLGGERYLFLWREPVALAEDEFHAYLGTGGDGAFARPPVYGRFTAGDFQLTVMTVHLGTKPVDREVELSLLKKWMQGRLSDDWVVAGDFNRLLGSGPAAEKPWHLLAPSATDPEWRLPLQDGAGVSHMQSTVADEYSTTCVDSGNMYDQFIVSRACARRIDGYANGEMPRWGEQGDVGVLDYDNSDRYVHIRFRGLNSIISDHRPIWVDFCIDLPDDD